VRRLSARIRLILAALLGVGVVLVPAALLLGWDLGVEPRVAQKLAQKLGRHVLVGSVRPRVGGLRLSDVVVFGTPPFESVPLLSAGAIDVDINLPGATFGRAAITGITLRRTRLAIVRDGLRGTDNIGDLFDRMGSKARGEAKPRAARGGGVPVELEGGTVELAYRDLSNLRWSMRASDIDAELVSASGTVEIGHARLEVAGAAGEFKGTHVELEGGHVKRVVAASGRLGLVGAEDLIGGARLTAERDPDNGWRVRIGAPKARLFADVGPSGYKFTVDADHLPLAPLRPIGDPNGFGLTQAWLDSHVLLRWRPREDALGVEGRVEAGGMTLTQRRLTTGAVTGARVSLSGSLVAEPRHGRVAVDQAALRVGELAIWLKGRVFGMRAGETMRVDADVRVDPTRCQAVLDSMPAGLVPALDGARLAGELSGRAKLRVDMDRLDDTVLDLALPEHCVVLRESARADVTRLRLSEVPYRVEDANGKMVDFPLGPSNPDWRPLNKISPHLVYAFLTAEDARFFSHKGFEPEMMRRALIENIRLRRVVRGASTISQQLTKNLFLERARTLSRKLQEAALTWRIEQTTNKRRILELYLNAIEFGPGTYGVRQASLRYFGKEPNQLTPLEAAHLASVAPNPKGYWTRFHSGPADDDWMEKLYDLLGMMRRSHRLSDGDFAQAVSQKLQIRGERL
jgi:hypothetical protein